LAGSWFVSTQVALQAFSELGQLAMQVPLLQICPPLHDLPQAPQLPGSVLVSTHSPLQSVQGCGGLDTQAIATTDEAAKK
jgi:hypothetical protein